MIIEFILTVIIVGFVTSGLKIRFDRFFAILLLFLLVGESIQHSIDIFLWVILLGALHVILSNREKLAKTERKMKFRLFGMIPVMTLASAFVGSYLFSISPSYILVDVLGILAVLYGLKMIVVHFEHHELNYENPRKSVLKACSRFGPIISGLSLGFIGSSLKPLKIAFALKIGRMNAKQVYLANTITAFFSAMFAIIFHAYFMHVGSALIFNDFLFGAGLWTGIHYTFELTYLFFKDKWRKTFQIIIGIILLIAAIKIFAMV